MLYVAEQLDHHLVDHIRQVGRTDHETITLLILIITTTVSDTLFSSSSADVLQSESTDIARCYGTLSKVCMV